MITLGSQETNVTFAIPAWARIGIIALTVIVAQILIIKGFKQQESRYQVQKSTAMMARPEFVAAAQQVAQSAVDLNRYDGYAWFNLGTSVYLQSKFPDALAILSRAITVLPHSYNAVRLIAFSHYALKDYPRAVEEFDRYLAMIPNPPVTPELVFGRAGLAALRVGELEEASYYLLRATPVEPNKADNLRARILTDVLSNRVGGASYNTALFRHYLPGEELNPFEVVANALRGGKVATATSYLEQIVPESGDDLSVTKALAAAYSSSGQADKAETLVVAAVGRHPESGSLRLVYGDILYAQKRFPEALMQYDEHLRLQPDSPLRGDIEQKKKAAEAAP